MHKIIPIFKLKKSVPIAIQMGNISKVLEFR
ncbi:hypothetical protein RHABOEDO_001897 (plasmid) [Candidatus Rhabdochlamydia oedothoracis]|uniref:Uncharacterized protein n=1 Tax=Candidatus Rhabdochlamydia oedothoracis TaxID=2720720 RepID=A0ABX8V2L7_9BACT|nr:hypothetical protein RHOW815_000734 [Candidatus Rhabdochlamydia sp. W815]QYF49498.1 hypothetical protein RHABOEDO_001897 [Candidatus Rhabdochlamydia oedothoracis]